MPKKFGANRLGKRTSSGKEHVIYGQNACLAVLKNKSREVKSIFITHEKFVFLKEQLNEDIKLYLTKIHVVDNEQISKKLGSKDKHQGMVIYAGDLLEKTQLKHVLQQKNTVIFLLDDVQDPQNIGAIIRSAFCFGVSALLLPKHNCPQIGSTIVRASAGYSEELPIIFINGAARAVMDLKNNDFTIIGLDGSSNTILPSNAYIDHAKRCFVFGSEGFGISELALKRCDFICKLPMIPKAESLNVSNAAAIVGYVNYINLDK